ncbi:MAG: class I SAM-dependent methyltransferase [Pirellulales bacterium]|nr:class I SAM-dependent methyltransferase [Pirellulales bacterium]
MRLSPEPRTAEVPDWDALYRQGTPPWETGHPAKELVRVLDQGLIPPGRTLEVGCGTGADAVYLATLGFEVTAVDSSPLAMERARVRAEQQDVVARFVLADVFEFAATAGQFDLVYDAGFYHFIRRTDLSRFLDMLWRVTRPGSYYLALVGSSAERAAGGPPRVTNQQVRDELGRVFEFVHLRSFRFESPRREQGYRGWSCLMRRPKIPR